MSYRICGPTCENGCGRPTWKDGLCSPCWRLRRITGTPSEPDSLTLCRDLYDLPSYEPTDK